MVTRALYDMLDVTTSTITKKMLATYFRITEMLSISLSCRFSKIFSGHAPTLKKAHAPRFTELFPTSIWFDVAIRFQSWGGVCKGVSGVNLHHCAKEGHIIYKICHAGISSVESKPWLVCQFSLAYLNLKVENHITVIPVVSLLTQVNSSQQHQG